MTLITLLVFVHVQMCLIIFHSFIAIFPFRDRKTRFYVPEAIIQHLWFAVAMFLSCFVFIIVKSAHIEVILVVNLPGSLVWRHTLLSRGQFDVCGWRRKWWYTRPCIVYNIVNTITKIVLFFQAFLFLGAFWPNQSMWILWRSSMVLIFLQIPTDSGRKSTSWSILHCLH